MPTMKTLQGIRLELAAVSEDADRAAAKIGGMIDPVRRLRDETQAAAGELGALEAAQRRLGVVGLPTATGQPSSGGMVDPARLIREIDRDRQATPAGA